MGFGRKSLIPPDMPDMEMFEPVQSGLVRKTPIDTEMSLNPPVANIDVSFLESAMDVMTIGDESIIFSRDIYAQRNLIVGDIQSVGDVECGNLAILGEVVTSSSHVTEGMLVDGLLESGAQRTLGLATADVFNARLLEAGESIITPTIFTSLIKSPVNINLVPNNGFVVETGNVRLGLIVSDAIIDSPAVKSNRLFIVCRNVVLQTDASCSGIEIIIYNNSRSRSVSVRQSVIVTDTSTETVRPGQSLIEIKSGATVRLICVMELNRWIRV